MTKKWPPTAAKSFMSCPEKRRSETGILLTYWMMEMLLREDSLDDIDLGRGGDTYKHDWLGKSRLRTSLIAGNWKSTVLP